MLIHLFHFDSLICDMSLCLAVSYSDSYMQHNILYRYHIREGDKIFCLIKIPHSFSVYLIF